MQNSTKGLKGMLGILLFLALLQGIRLFIAAIFPGIAFCNPGAAFGVAVPGPFIGLLGACALFFLALQWWKSPSGSQSVAWLLLIGAGASNLSERLWYGCVTDYLSFVFLFNAADAVLAVGTIFLIVSALRKRPNT